MAKKEEHNEEVYQFPGQEDQVEYKPKGLTRDVIVDALRSSALVKRLNVRMVLWVIIAAVVLFVAMNFRLFLNWTHIGFNHAHKGTMHVTHRMQAAKKEAPKRVVVKKTPKLVATKKAHKMDKDQALALINQAQPAKAPKVPPLLKAKPKQVTPVLVEKPKTVAKAPVLLVKKASPAKPTVAKGEALLQQVMALDVKQKPQPKVVNKPKPVDHVSMKAMQDMQSTVQTSLSKLNQQLSVMEKQQTLLQSNIQSVVHQLKDMQAVIAQMKKQQPQKKTSVSKPKAVTAVAHKAAAKATPVTVVHYRVSAMVYGRAWLEEKDSKKVVSVRVGDRIPGMKGRVKSIYLEDFFVETTHGEHIYDHFE